ncbi:MAG: patatin-like phospholipase family protein [Bacteroidales bacterium]|nr:patatin-like phospholipase family protein [Bacteroidales bacterium]
MKRTIAYLSISFMLAGIAIPVSAQQETPGRPKVGLVLSGGGAKGIAHVGVLKVLEKAGLKIDYIGGTSMGSIVSGLYAIGYDADSLHEIVVTRDWDKLLSDEISRRDLSIEEKPDYDRFFVSFPLQEKKVKLPAGVVTGQNIENEFAELCSHVNNIRDFNKFQIPFLCIASDVETGQEQVFHEGNLAACMRASMSIPSVFSPLEIDGKYYIDGGVINNFPADHIKAMGADILIGVDVGFEPKTVENGFNLIKVIEQTIFMASHARMEANKELCDILIRPDITGYGVSSFSSGDSLIARGEWAAMEYFDRFKALADSLNSIEYIPYEKPSFDPRDSLFLREIYVEGIEHVSGRLLSGKLNLNVLNKVTPARISEAISNVYSSLFFEKVTYELEPMTDDLLGEGVRLKIKVRERTGGQLKVGLNYNSTYKASITLNTTFRNFLLNGSKSSLNLALGENPYFLARFEKNNGWKPGFVVELGAQNYDLNLYDEGSRDAIIDYSDIVTRIYTQSIIENSYSFGLGGEFERIALRPEVGSPILAKLTENYYNFLAFVNLDTYDNRFYPRKGTRIDGLFKFIKNPTAAPEWFLRFNLEQATSFGRRFTLIPRIYGGFTSADSSLLIYHFYLGGLNKTPRKGFLPFTGLNFMERSGRNALAFSLDLQYNFWESNYLILKANIANTTWHFGDLILFDNAFSGYGLTLGNMSLIGPIELTLMRSNDRNEFIFYVNIGYYF